MRTMVAAAVACLTLTGLTLADNARASIKKTTIAPQPLGSALQTLSHDRDIHLVYISEDVNALRTNGATGDLSMDEALTQILSGTGLTYKYLDENSITILPHSETQSNTPERANSKGPAPARTGEAQKNPSFWDQFRLAQVDQGQTAGGGQVESSSAASDDDAERRRQNIEEVIVTAQKREERLQDVPISIAVIGNQDIERRGLIGMEDYLRSIPGVAQIDRGSIDNAIIIRGITTSPSVENFGSGATVATYFNETPITAAAGLLGGGIDARPVDIERIEVLRGPQGTTYGSSSLGGTLRIIPVKPELGEFGAKVIGSYSVTSGIGSDNSILQSVVNIPVADRFAIRAVGYRYDDSGIYRNNVGADANAAALATTWGIADQITGYTPSVGRMETTGARLAALWQITDALQFNLEYLTQDIEQEGFPAATSGTFGQISFPITPAARRDGMKQEGYRNGLDLVSATIDYDLGWGALTSATSWVDGETDGVRDAWGVSTAFGGFSLPDRSTFESFTQELRLASRLAGPVQFLAGLYYEDINPTNFQLLIPFGAPAVNRWATNPAFLADRDFTTTQRAVFGELSYELTDSLKLTAGVRHFDYDKRERLLREGGLVGVPLGAGVPVVTKSNEADETYKVNLAYKPTETTMVYALWSQGFRLGKPATRLSPICDADNDGVVDGTGVPIASTSQVNSDFLDNYELGGKFSLLDRRLQVDVAVYHIDWTGLPVNALAPACNLAYVANAGSAQSDGAEVQASWLAMQGLRFDFGVGYTRAELAEDVPLQGWREGARLPGSPKVNANLAAQYDFNLGPRAAFVRLDSLYADTYFGDLLETARLESGGYISVGARAGMKFGELGIELYGRNLTDEDEATWRSTANTASATNTYRLRPRTVGLQLSYEF